MKLSPEQEEYIRCLAYVRSFRKANPAAALVARNEGVRRSVNANRKKDGEKWRAYRREYMRAQRAKIREELKLTATMPRFSEITLSNGERSIDIHVFESGRWSIARTQRGYGDKRPQKQTARAWIRKGLHGDLSEEPEFVRSTFAAIKTSK